ncbi:hypothetical protein BD414DRAFT_478831 [Trametes punicea]|nr:hypothetical protein BD414DRAFT_478831 [Trametes punicea]
MLPHRPRLKLCRLILPAPSRCRCPYIKTLRYSTDSSQSALLLTRNLQCTLPHVPRLCC